MKESAAHPPIAFRTDSSLWSAEPSIDALLTCSRVTVAQRHNRK